MHRFYASVPLSLAFDPGILIGIAGSTTLLALLIWGLWFWLKSTDEPRVLIKKWIYTALILGGGGAHISHGFKSVTTLGAFLIAAETAIMGLLLAMVWGRSIIDGLTAPFLALFDGGSETEERKPLYSPGIGRRKRGDSRGAVAWIRSQLAMFPHDVEGYRLLMEIYLEDFKDSLRAEEVMDEFLAEFDEQPPREACFLIHYLADWKVAVEHDAEAAESLLRRIIRYYPGAEASRKANQAIERLPEKLSRARKMHSEESVQMVTPDSSIMEKSLKRPENSMAIGQPSAVAGHGVVSIPADALQELKEQDQIHIRELIQRLKTYPSDWETREELAGLYAMKLRRQDLAENEIRYLIDHPSGSRKAWTAKWLNRLADYKLALCDTPDEARHVLNELIESCPGPEAEKARNRLKMILVEHKGAKSRLEGMDN